MGRLHSAPIDDEVKRAVEFSPLSLPNLELYLDSRLGTSAFADGASLTTWPDFSGHSPIRDAVIAAYSGAGFVAPTIWKTTGAQLTPTGRPTVEWGLTTAFPGNILGSAGTFLWPDTATRGYTFYYYGRTISKVTPTWPFVNQVAFGSNNAISALRPELVLDLGTGIPTPRSIGAVDDAGGGNPHSFNLLSTISNTWKLHTWIFPVPNNNTTPMSYFLNGVSQAQVSGPANWQAATGTTRYNVGGNFTGNVVVRGNQGFFLWFSDTHSQGIIDLFVNWASAYWGLT